MDALSYSLAPDIRSSGTSSNIAAPDQTRNPSIKESTLCFPPFGAARAKLGETKTTFLNTPEERCRPSVSQL